MAGWAEAARLHLFQDWIGIQPDDWAEPVTVDFEIAAGSGGCTNLWCDGGRWLGASGRWTGTRVSDTTVPHEVMHCVLASHLGLYSPRFLDEGIAVTVEAPDEDVLNWFDLARRQLAAGQARTIRQLWSEREYSDQTYPQGTAIVAMLLEWPQGRRGLVDVCRSGIEGDPGEAFGRVYGKTPEQVDADFRAWLPRRSHNSQERVIAGVPHIFSERRWVPQAAPPAPAPAAPPIQQTPETIPNPNPPAMGPALIPASPPPNITEPAPNITEPAPIITPPPPPPVVPPAAEIVPPVVNPGPEYTPPYTQPPPSPPSALIQDTLAGWIAGGLVAVGVAAPVAVPVAGVAVGVGWWLGRRRLKQRLRKTRVFIGAHDRRIDQGGLRGRSGEHLSSLRRRTGPGPRAT